MKTIGEINREWFNNVADSAYKIQWIRDLMDQITSFLRENVEWIGLPAKHEDVKEPLRMLDYACGNGVASMALAPYVSTLRGIDISEGMVKQYNDVASSQGLSEEQMHAVQGDLLGEPEKLSDPDFFNFNVVVMSTALHHVEDPGKMIQRLADRLATGGSLVIVDMVAPGETGDDPTPPKHPASHTVTRNGFGRQEMLDMFSQAGLVDAEIKWLPQSTPMPIEVGGQRQLFFVRGKKA